MALQKLFLGTTTGDKTGTGAKSAGQMINANFDYLEAKIDNVNKVVLQTGLSLVDQTLTMITGWQWLINGVLYINPFAVSIIIPFSTAGKQRIDLIVVNTSNTFTRIAGIESISNPVAPTMLNDTIQATLILVTDGVIEITKSDNYKHSHNIFKFIQKGFGNINLASNEINDIFCGWSNDGTLRYPEAKWLGGALNNSDNFKPLITIIIE